MKKALVQFPLIAMICLALASPAFAEGADRRTTDATGINGYMNSYPFRDGTPADTSMANGGNRGLGIGAGDGLNRGDDNRAFTNNRGIGDRSDTILGVNGERRNNTMNANDNNSGNFRARGVNDDNGNRSNNDGNFRARAADTNNTNWSWLGLFGLLGLAGLFRGNNRERDRA